VGSLSFSPVGARLASGATGRIVALWDVVRRERVGRLTPGKPTTPVVAWSALDGHDPRCE
jgi:hypothetical protein